MIFLELVPRDLLLFVTESKAFLDSFTNLTGINVPDIIQIKNRSYTSANALLQHQIVAIPHIRTQDASISEHLKIIKQLYDSGLRSLLLVSGDPIKESLKPAFETTPVTLTSAIKNQFKDIKVYCALDPYRQRFEQECDYAKKKIAAGADGFFSQPFFDSTLLTLYLDAFKECDFFTGISPIMSEKSKKYWETVNKVVFPKEFSCDFSYNCNLAKELLDITKYYKQHSYLMPIKCDVKSYLKCIFN